MSLWAVTRPRSARWLRPAQAAASTAAPTSAGGTSRTGSGRSTSSGGNWIFNLLNIVPDTERIRSAEALFHSCVNQAAKKAWLRRGRVPDEFRPRHALLVAHIWMVNKRLINSGTDEGKRLQESLFDLLWEDTTLRIRSMGIGELSVNKNLNDVQKYTFGHLVDLDGSLAAAGLAERADRLGAACWRHQWLGESKLTVEHCLIMSEYLREKLETIHNLDEADFLEGRIPWGPVPNWDGVLSLSADASNPDGVVSATSEEELALDEEEETSEWREALSQTGQTYYWNINTRESRWTKPE